MQTGKVDNFERDVLVVVNLVVHRNILISY
jgi:hypothetical protein